MIYNIQALRALAVIMVIFAHLYPFLAVFGLKPFGGQGVDLFFVISGFIMVKITRDLPPKPLVFMRNRFLRITPAYWTVTLLVYLVAVIVPNTLKSTNSNTIELAKSLLFIPYVKWGNTIQPVLFTGWTLNYEMFFYLLFSLSLLLKNYLHSLMAVLATLGALSLSGAIMKSHDPIIQFYTKPIILEFAMGIILGITLYSVPVNPPQYLRRAVGVISALGILAMVCMPYFDLFSASHLLSGFSRLLNAGLPAMILVGSAIVLERWRCRACSPIIESVGNSSYIIYLIHPFLTVPAVKLLNIFHTNKIFDVFLVAADLAVIIVAGIILHYKVERPVIGWLRSALSNRRRDLDMAVG